ncbi:MAG: Ig-like domain-containing protein [Nitrospirota bacterium]
MLLTLVVATAGCDRDHGATAPPAGSTVPAVIFTIPADGSTGVPINRKVSAAFSEPMGAATVTDIADFTVTGPGLTPVTALTITYDAATRVALFTPTVDLLNNTTYTGTITVGARNTAGTPMAADYVWTFTTGAAADIAAPLLLITAPVHTAMNVPVNQKITATFNEPMDPTTITAASYLVTGPTGTIAGTISYLGATATFEPVSLLTTSTTYTVVIAASDLAGNPWTGGNVPNPWIFTTIPEPVPFVSVNMGLAAPFAIAATAGVTNTITAPLSHINGNVVLDPNQTCNAVTVDNAGGFGLCGGMAPTINGIVITNLYPDTTTSTAVKADLNAAFLSITPPAGPPAAGGLGGGTPIASPTTMGAVTGSLPVLGDNYFTPGVYTSITSMLITDDVTLDGLGDPNATFIFQSASSLTVADGAPLVHGRILLTNGTKASNVWWQVGSSATIGTYAEFYGNILAAFDITMKTSSTACGRSMAGAWVGGAGAFILDTNVVSVPGHPSAPVGCE